MDLKMRFSGGISIEHNGLSILIDPYRKFDPSKYDYVLITHGHTDHFTSSITKANNLIMTKQTRDILSEVYGLKLDGSTVIEIGDLLVLDELSIRALNAGHVIGSAMYLLEFNDLSIGVTGDFNMEDSIVQRGADSMRDIDILIMEGTYGSESYIFRPRSELYDLVLNEVEQSISLGNNVIFSGHPLGKGQELAVLLQKYKPFLDYNVYKLNKLLLKEPMGSIMVPEADHDEPIVAITGTHGDLRLRFRNVFKLKRPMNIIGVTGWGYGNSIQLSNHSDYLSLVKFALESRAKAIYTVYGNAALLAQSLRRKYGLNAHLMPTNEGDITSY